jgi:hypothetical protein
LSRPSEKTDVQVKQKRRALLLGLGIVLITVIAFEQIRHNGFVYDDLLYITQNSHVAGGINSESAKWAFTTTYAGIWHPVTWLSHLIDCRFFKLNPLWPHLENLLLHIINALLLFWILKGLTGAIWKSTFVAVLFAVHTLRVESVAWAAERKDLLCGLFWMLTIAAYVRYARSPRTGNYLLVVIFFVLGLMSKPMIVTLPFVLLLLDYWPLDRFRGERQFSHQKQSLWRLITEKIPLFALSAASSVITFVAQQKQGAMNMLEYLPVRIRAANALISYTAYISKMLYPGNLAVLYPHPGRDVELWYVLSSLGAVMLVSIAVFRLGRRYPYLAVGWLWYVGTLVPVIGLVQIGAQGMADRYTYLPSIGFFIMITWGIAELARRWRFLKIVLPITAVIIVSLLVICTRRQVRYWRNNFTLFERTLSVTENNPAVLYNIGAVLQAKGNSDLAAECYRQALRYNTDYTQTIQLAEKAAKLTNYQDPVILETLAAAYASAGQFDLAVTTTQQAIALTSGAGDVEFTEHLRKQLELYKQRKLPQPAVEQNTNRHF